MRRSGLDALLLRLPSWRGAIVLSYHRIGGRDLSDLHRGLFSATPELLDRQLRLIVRHFDVTTPDHLDVRELSRTGRRVLVTFDDGYRDLYEVAFPVLQANGVSSTMFLCSGLIDGTVSAWWDEIAWMLRHASRPGLPPGPWCASPLRLEGPGIEHAIDVTTWAYWGLEAGAGADFLDRLATSTGAGRRTGGSDDWITWEMARAMSSAGQRIGAHTATHPILARLPPDGQRREIVSSLDRIEAELGQRPQWLAYPVGTRSAFNTTTVTVAHDVGLKLAFSNYGGRLTPSNFKPLDVRRVPAESLRLPALFSATLALPQLLIRPTG